MLPVASDTSVEMQADRIREAIVSGKQIAPGIAETHRGHQSRAEKRRGRGREARVAAPRDRPGGGTGPPGIGTTRRGP